MPISHPNDITVLLPRLMTYYDSANLAFTYLQKLTDQLSLLHARFAPQSFFLLPQHQTSCCLVFVSGVQLPQVDRFASLMYSLLVHF